MATSIHTVHDFQIGESVVPVNKSELTLVIVDIQEEKNRITCRLTTEIEGLVQDYNPRELEKEFIMRPSNIILPKPGKINPSLIDPVC